MAEQARREKLAILHAAAIAAVEKDSQDVTQEDRAAIEQFLQQTNAANGELFVILDIRISEKLKDSSDKIARAICANLGGLQTSLCNFVSGCDLYTGYKTQGLYNHYIQYWFEIFGLIWIEESSQGS